MRRMLGTTGMVSALAAALAAVGVSSAAELEVIYTKIPGHPTAAVPGALDLNGDPVATDFRALEDIFLSPDGSTWALKGRTQLGSDLENILLIGGGTSGHAIAQEGQPIIGGAPGELYDFFGSGVGRFNSLNQFAYSARARGGVSSVFQKVLVWDNGSFTLRFQMGDPIFQLQDDPPGNSGDELFGNSVGSIHILDNGTIGSQDSTIQNIHSSRRPAIMYNDQAFHQSNVTQITSIDEKDDLTWATLDANTFYTTPDGAHWLVEGRVVLPSDMDTVLVYDNRVRLQESMPIGSTGVIVADIFRSELIASGDWFARGDQPDDNDWAVRNGELLAATGQPITRCLAETWGDVFGALTGNSAGHWVLVGNTNNADPAADQVLVLDGKYVLVREGDPVDLDGNGQFDDDVFIGRGNNTLSAFEPNDLHLTESGEVYLLASIRDGAGNDLNSNPAFGAPQAFLRIVLSLESCDADLDCSGEVDFNDLVAVLSAYGVSDAGDVDGDGDTDFDDLFGLLSEYGNVCF